MKRVTHCDKHKRYTPGCTKCLTQSRLYRGVQPKDRNDDTHHKNGQPKIQGLFAQCNWDKFNAMGKRLTNYDGHFNRSMGS